MPQISLKLSSNINLNLIDFKPMFEAIHHELFHTAQVDIKSCHSGVLQETYSYIGFGDSLATKVYLQILWLENPERLSIKTQLAKNLMLILETMLVTQIVNQNLICIPRVHINDLGKLNLDYLIGEDQAK